MAICLTAFYYFDWKAGSNIWVVAIFYVEVVNNIINIWTQIVVHLLEPSEILQRLISVPIPLEKVFFAVDKIPNQFIVAIFGASFFDYELDLEISTDLFIVYVLISVEIIIRRLVLSCFEDIKVLYIGGVRKLELDHRHKIHFFKIFDFTKLVIIFFIEYGGVLISGIVFHLYDFIGQIES